MHNIWIKILALIGIGPAMMIAGANPNITVPAAPSSGYCLVSTTTGAYVASTTICGGGSGNTIWQQVAGVISPLTSSIQFNVSSTTMNYYGAFTQGRNTLIATGLYSSAFGDGSNAGGTASFAANDSTSIGIASFSGNYGSASGEASAAFGDSTDAIGASSFAVGESTSANGDDSFVGGRGGHANGSRSFAYGFAPTAAGVDSVAFGHLALSPYANSMVFTDTNGGTTNGTNQAVLSFYNNIILNPTSGNVGIATTTPDSKLDIYGDVRFETASSSVITPIIGGLIVGTGCDSATTSVDINLASTTTSFVTTPQDDPGTLISGFYSFLSSPGIITTRVCGVGITPNSSKYVVKIIK